MTPGVDEKSLAFSSFEGLRAGQKKSMIRLQANNEVNQSIHQT
jgi:hypothetical protein